MEQETTEQVPSNSVDTGIPQGTQMSFDAPTATVARTAAPPGSTAGLEFVDLTVVKVAQEAVDLAPGDFALKNQVLPVGIEDGILYVAIGSSAALSAVDDLGILLNMPVRPVLADPQLVRDRIEERFMSEILSQ